MKDRSTSSATSNPLLTMTLPDPRPTTVSPADEPILLPPNPAVTAVPGYNVASMSNWFAILLAAAVSASAPLTLETELDKGTLTVEFQLQESLC